MSMQKLPEDYEAVLPKLYMLHTDERRKEAESYLIMKRMIDIFFSALGLLVLMPLFVVVAILIKLEDPKGKVFFRQNRVGKNEKQFPMYKFRSMVSNAEELKENLMAYNEVSGAMFKIKNDPRITQIGRFLRKTSIDELPQLWNVLIGQMSLVGPRPPLPEEVAQYTEYDKQRLTVTPGCTGYWQVNARNSVGFDEMVQLDLTYIHIRSTMLDLKIIAKTGLMLLGSKDAY
ncbi:multidrug MFS transporter [Paenibacillus sp. VTT E-133280]|jgi:lipopolysaccharide/colanic/teichoic acid biosynthesis glycosyltransferase|uniref:Multidrug MFS transporter n=1 Tax=Paenibacillus odorifer TaxID=189426 RepID=A0A1R0ZKK0_9BACL|nr:MULTISPECIES: sugar transferase [Paenibacillus]AIQ22224.1 multidrug MFS transporter [Paenibacillus sp. FSL H7-0737]AIQ33971.1 multidrug MFS transporter [Paenibacillus sp. FSL R5-0345]KAA1183340.1 sugar transferase [Paenibacillus sp. B2(2019)]OMD39511.1 multidrug MFS transporter [Paenibacillus odorifer]OMD52721.1 multidrug MFS transporter [Paenibacillus odorifer]